MKHDAGTLSQFLSRSRSKSNLLFATVCSCNAIFAAAISLQSFCSSLSNGFDQVAETPADKLYPSCCPVLVGT